MIILGECVHRDFISKQQYLCPMIKNTKEIPLKMYMKRPASRDNNAQKGIFAQSVELINSKINTQNFIQTPPLPTHPCGQEKQGNKGTRE